MPLSPANDQYTDAGVFFYDPTMLTLKILRLGVTIEDSVDVKKALAPGYILRADHYTYDHSFWAYNHVYSLSLSRHIQPSWHKCSSAGASCAVKRVGVLYTDVLVL